MTHPNTDEIITNKELPALFNALPGRDDHEGHIIPWYPNLTYN